MTRPDDRLQPGIGDYGFLGDTRSAALVSRAGSVDWLCIPRFDADPVFGYLIDAAHGGRFEAAVDGAVESRRYRQSSAVLETRWRGPNGDAVVVDAMPVSVKGLRPQLALIRRIECTEGEVSARVLFDPRLGLPGKAPKCSRRWGALVCEWGSLAMVLQTFPQIDLTHGEIASCALTRGQSLTLVASLADRTPAVLMTEADAVTLISETDSGWRRWASEIDYSGPFRDEVIRSLIVLRQLTYSPSGAPVAAPTMSLPERIGGSLNWDYRYAWPRDAGIGSGAFIAAGRREEARAFLRWLYIASRLSLPRMSVLYTLDGTPGHKERELDGISGYRRSLPVRAANAAGRQHQLDVYGWIVDTAWHLTSMGERIDGPSWRMVRSLADFVCQHWQEPDAGIWEEREQPQHHVSSKLLSFVALDRAARIADARGEAGDHAAHWLRESAAIRSEVRRCGWDPMQKSYTATYGSRELDASSLLAAMSEVDDDRPERISATVDAIRNGLGAGDVLLYRRRQDMDGQSKQGAFVACTFWLIDAMARCGRIEEAERAMESAVKRGGELGLLGEETDPSSGEALGNYPQALSHSTLVSAALSIEAAKASRSHPGLRHTRRAREA